MSVKEVDGDEANQQGGLYETRVGQTGLINRSM